MMKTHILEGTDGHGKVWLACDKQRPRESGRVAVVGRALVLKSKSSADLIDCIRCRRAYALAPIPEAP